MTDEIIDDLRFWLFEAVECLENAIVSIDNLDSIENNFKKEVEKRGLKNESMWCHNIEKKADINKPKNNGVTPFFIASYNGHLDIVKYLKNKGAK